MRSLSRFLVPVAAAAVIATLVPAGAATAAPVVPAPLFGMHVNSLSGGAPKALTRVGAIRLWDTGITWRNVEKSNNSYDWSKFDAAVRNAEALGATEILYTLGMTPRWAAANPDSKGALYGAGSNSHPKSNSYYLDYLRAVATRYKGRITAYQVWNEANLGIFYTGTPTQLAQLSKRARATLRSVDPKAKLVGASTTVRAKGPVGKWGRAYGPAMRRAGWPVDVVSAHLYPPSKTGPATRVSYIKVMKRYYKRWGAGSKPLWDTEVNFGDRRPAMGYKVYSGATAATHVARTYIDAMRYGVKRVFWYSWDSWVLGTDMTRKDRPTEIVTGGVAFLEVQRWMVGRTWLGCKVRSRVTTCSLRGPGSAKSSIRYASGRRTVVVPAGVTKIRRLDGSSTPVKKGQRVALTSQPVLFR